MRRENYGGGITVGVTDGNVRGVGRGTKISGVAVRVGRGVILFAFVFNELFGTLAFVFAFAFASGVGVGVGVAVGFGVGIGVGVGVFKITALLLLKSALKFVLKLVSKLTLALKSVLSMLRLVFKFVSIGLRFVLTLTF